MWNAKEGVLSVLYLKNIKIISERYTNIIIIWKSQNY